MKNVSIKKMIRNNNQRKKIFIILWFLIFKCMTLYSINPEAKKLFEDAQALWFIGNKTKALLLYEQSINLDKEILAYDDEGMLNELIEFLKLKVAENDSIHNLKRLADTNRIAGKAQEALKWYTILYHKLKSNEEKEKVEKLLAEAEFEVAEEILRIKKSIEIKQKFKEKLEFEAKLNELKSKKQNELLNIVKLPLYLKKKYLYPENKLIQKLKHIYEHPFIKFELNKKEKIFLIESFKILPQNKRKKIFEKYPLIFLQKALKKEK